MYNPFSLEGKTICVTGASSGIGAATAIQCSRMGAKLVITARNRERLEKTFSELEGEGHELFVADLTQETEIDQLVARLPALDGVVHCAGIVFTKLAKFINTEDIARIFSSNFNSHVLLSQKILKLKKLKKASSVVFISSLSAWSGSPGNSLYAATKGALNSFARTLANEVSPQKIRVNSIQPAMVETPLISLEKISDEQLELDRKKYPLGRYGIPEDIAYLIIYLLSDASQWMTGNIITIDGGLTLRK
jgi:NAD(P)-dependent dehydrogenase (short-subunit alcohol dehydrogenase family)